MKGLVNLCGIDNKLMVWSFESAYCCTNSMFWYLETNAFYLLACYCISSDYELSRDMIWAIIYWYFNSSLKFITSGWDEIACYILRSLVIQDGYSRPNVLASQLKGIRKPCYYRVFLSCRGASWFWVESTQGELCGWSQSLPTTHASWRWILPKGCYYPVRRSNSTQIDLLIL